MEVAVPCYSDVLIRSQPLIAGDYKPSRILGSHLARNVRKNRKKWASGVATSSKLLSSNTLSYVFRYRTHFSLGVTAHTTPVRACVFVCVHIKKANSFGRNPSEATTWRPVKPSLSNCRIYIPVKRSSSKTKNPIRNYGLRTLRPLLTLITTYNIFAPSLNKESVLQIYIEHNYNKNVNGVLNHVVYEISNCVSRSLLSSSEACL
jgi:hypothetical protein